MASYGQSKNKNHEFMIQHFITKYPASIGKADISRLHALKGAVNSEDVLLGETVYVAGSLEFHGFAGALNKASGKYEGVYRFTPCKSAGQEQGYDMGKVFSAADLPGLVADETELIEDSELEGEDDEPQ